MITVTGKIENAAGVTLHATIDFVSQSTPLISAGVVTTNTDKTIRSNPADGTFSVALAAGNYEVAITAEGQATTFNIAVPDGNGTVAIDTLVTTAVVYPYIAPNTVWNGQRAGHITFIPTAPPPAPTTQEIAYAGGGVDSGDNRYFYFVSYITPTGETIVSPALAVHLGSGAPTPNQANRIFLQANPAGVTSVRNWRSYVDNGHAYDTTHFPANVGLLATVSPSVGYYDDWESTAQFAARVNTAIIAPLLNTTAGELLSSAGTVCAYISDQGLAVPSLLTVQAGASFPGSNLRLTPGVGFELYNFDTQLWHTLLCTGNPAQLSLSVGHS